MEQSRFVNELNVKRLQNLLDTSADDAERLKIKKLLAEEEAKQPASKPLHPR
jgi:hypothetical protein